MMKGHTLKVNMHYDIPNTHKQGDEGLGGLFGERSKPMPQAQKKMWHPEGTTFQLVQNNSDPPTACTIDRLQGKKYTYNGELTPTSFTVKTLLEQIRARMLNYCTPLLTAVALGFKHRFSKYISFDAEINDAVLATVSHPYFKIRQVGLKKGMCR